MLSVIGIIAVKKIPAVSLVPFAIIPLLFAVQQFSEGFVWLAGTNVISAAWKQPSVLFFLLFAQVVWPVWVPFSIFLLEKQPLRRKILLALLVAGAILAIYHLYCLAAFPVSAEIADHHIDYRLGYSSFAGGLGSMVYIMATILPPFISGVKKMPLLGLCILLSFLVTLFFYKTYVISVWCFFAALISVIVVLILSPYKHQGKAAAGRD